MTSLSSPTHLNHLTHPPHPTNTGQPQHSDRISSVPWAIMHRQPHSLWLIHRCHTACLWPHQRIFMECPPNNQPLMRLIGHFHSALALWVTRTLTAHHLPTFPKSIGRAGPGLLRERSCYAKIAMGLNDYMTEWLLLPYHTNI